MGLYPLSYPLAWPSASARPATPALSPRGEGARLEFQFIDELADGGGRLVEGGLLVLLELDLDDLLDASPPELHRDADVEALGPVLAAQVGRAGHHLLLVLQDRLYHLHRAGGGGVVGAARLEERHDLGTPVGGARDQALDL